MRDYKNALAGEIGTSQQNGINGVEKGQYKRANKIMSFSL